MATVSRESIGNLHDKLVVTLTKEDYFPNFEKALKTYSKQANIPGFRKGMVPSGMVRKMYGPVLFRDEVLHKASEQLQHFMDQQSIEIFGQPIPLPAYSSPNLDMNNPVDFNFSFEIGLKPDFQVPAIDGTHTLNQYKVQITDETIDDELLRLRKKGGNMEHPGTVTHLENIISASYTQTDAAGNKVSDAEPVTEMIMLEKMPKALQEQLMGKSVGDSTLFSPVQVCTTEELPGFMKNSLQSDMVLAENHYELTLTDIGILVPRELDPIFYMEIFPNDTITDENSFRNKIREELLKEFDHVAENRLNEEIYETLVHTTPIQLPVPFLKRWMQQGQEKPLSPEQVDREYPAFEHQLRWTLISDKLIREHDISVSRDEILNSMKSRVMAYFGMETDEDAPWMDGYMDKMSQDEKTMNETYRQMLFGKLFNDLKSRFILETKEIEEAEFLKLANAHAAHHHDH